MSKANTIQTNFSAGEVSPLLRGRVDVNKYANGAKGILNWVVKPQGAVTRRPGTKLQCRTKNSAKRSILRTFEFSNATAYMLEFGDLYVRILKDGAPIFPTTAPTFAGVVATVLGDKKIKLDMGAPHGLVQGQWISATGFGVTGGLVINQRWMVEYTPTANTIVLFNSYVSPTQTITSTGNVWTVPIEVVTPYLETELDSLYFAQSADILFICHPSYQTRMLARLSETSWSIALYTAEDGPYAQTNDQTIQLTVSGYTDVGAILCSTAILAGNATDNTKYIEYRDGDIWRLAKITAFGTTTVATVDVTCNVILGLDAAVTLKYASEKDLDMERQLYNRMHPKNKITDPGAGVSAPVTANFANTFSENDVGKYIRIAPNRWHQITVFTKDTVVTVAANPTFIAYTYPATTVKLTSRVITGTVTATSALFAATDVGRQVRLNYSGRWFWGTITAYTSTTVVTVLFNGPLPLDTAATSNISNFGIATEYKLGAWSNTTGWPQKVQFHEQRIVFARTSTEVQSLWMSRSADFTNMASTDEDSSVPDDAAISYSFASNEVNAITWLESSVVLLIGTSGGEWQARASTSVQEPITPKNISILQQTDYGSIDNIRGFRVGSAVLFIQRSGRKVREMTYNFELDKWVARDITVVAEHILRQGGKAYNAIYQKEPTSMLWVLLTDGTLATLTYDKDQEVVAWSRQVIDGTVEAISCIPANSGSDQEIYVVVKRLIGATFSTVIRTIEKVGPEFLPSTPNQTLSDACFFDGALTYSLNPNVTDVHGLAHLENKSVVVMADGVILMTGSNPTSFQISGGAITLPAPATKIQVGVIYSSKLDVLGTEGGSPFGTSQGKTKRIDKLSIRVVDSVSFRYGTDLDAITTFGTEESFNNGALYTGDFKVNLEAPYDLDSPFTIFVALPLPMTILALMPQVTTNE